MNKLSEVADRIKRKQSELNAEADKLAAKMDEVDKAAPAAFARGHAVVDAASADIKAMDDTLRQLSNIPLEESAPSPADLPAAPEPFPRPGA